MIWQRQPKKALKKPSRAANTSWGLRRIRPFTQWLEAIPFASLWNLVLLLGGGILLFYHAYIGYLPDFSLSDLVGLFSAVTLVGVVVVFFLSVGSLFPAAALTWWDSTTKTVHSDPKSFTGPIEASFLALFPMISWFLLLVLPTFEFLSKKQYTPSYQSLMWTACVTVGISFCATGKIDNDPAKGKYAFWLRLGRRAGGLAFWTVLTLAPIVIVMTLAAASEKAREWWVFSVGSFLLASMNVGAYQSGAKVWKVFVFSAAVFLLAFPLYGQRPAFLPELIVRSLSLGGRNAAEVVLSDKQCRTFSQFGANCGNETKGESQISLRNVNLLSRAGSSVLLEVLVEHEKGLPATSPLHTTEFDLYCPGANKNKDSMGCSKCDNLMLERLNDSETQADLTEETKAGRNYSANLICVQIAVPKEDIVSITWSGLRRYHGFTSISPLSK